MKNLQLFCLLLKSKRSAFSAQANYLIQIYTAGTAKQK
jgi:hypothetical protein